MQDPFMVSNNSDYLPYDLGLHLDVFVKWPRGLSPDYDIYGNHNLLGWVRVSVATTNKFQVSIIISIFLLRRGRSVELFFPISSTSIPLHIGKL